jgi:hypothetical protein
MGKAATPGPVLVTVTRLPTGTLDKGITTTASRRKGVQLAWMFIVPAGAQKAGAAAVAVASQASVSMKRRIRFLQLEPSCCRRPMAFPIKATLKFSQEFRRRPFRRTPGSPGRAISARFRCHAVRQRLRRTRAATPSPCPSVGAERPHSMQQRPRPTASSCSIAFARRLAARPRPRPVRRSPCTRGAGPGRSPATAASSASS